MKVCHIIPIYYLFLQPYPKLQNTVKFRLSHYSVQWSNTLGTVKVIYLLFMNQKQIISQKNVDTCNGHNACMSHTMQRWMSIGNNHVCLFIITVIIWCKKVIKCSFWILTNIFNASASSSAGKSIWTPVICPFLTLATDALQNWHGNRGYIHPLNGYSAIWNIPTMIIRWRNIWELLQTPSPYGSLIISSLEM